MILFGGTYFKWQKGIQNYSQNAAVGKKEAEIERNNEISLVVFVVVYPLKRSVSSVLLAGY